MRRRLRAAGFDVALDLQGLVKSGAVARCGGPALGWMVDVVRKPGAETDTIEVDIADDEADVKKIAEVLAKVLKRR